MKTVDSSKQCGAEAKYAKAKSSMRQVERPRAASVKRIQSVINVSTVENLQNI